VERSDLEEGSALALDFTKLDRVSGVVPVAVQDADSREVVLVAYTDESAMRESFARRRLFLYSIDFLKNLLTIAKEVLEAEKEVEPEDNRAKARAALTELFESIKNPQTPIIVEKIVNDIDTQIVEIVRRFSDAFSTVSGRREIQQRLRSTLYIKYQIKDKEVFEKAYRLLFTPEIDKKSSDIKNSIDLIIDGDKEGKSGEKLNAVA